MADIQESQGESIGAGSRKRFVRRYKDQIKERLKENIDTTKIKDISSKRKVRVVTKTLDEPHYRYDPLTGKKEYVGNSNDNYIKGDREKKRARTSQEAAGGAGQGEDEYGDFSFELTKEELIDLLFEDMELPDYIKESLKTDTFIKIKRRGHTVDGIPVNINPVRTIMAAMARKIAFKGSVAKRIEEAETEEEKEELRKKKAPFLEDTDLRYKRYDKEEEPIRNAVMIMVMDVSGSMTQNDRDLAKRFFLLLYLFLEKSYSNVEMRFLTYTTYALEVSEEEFFNDGRYGGTSVLSGANLTKEVIKKYDTERNNIYLAHVSDGDMLTEELEDTTAVYDGAIMPFIQYAAYLELKSVQDISALVMSYGSYTPVSAIYLALKQKYKNIGVAHATEAAEIFPALQELFRK